MIYVQTKNMKDIFSKFPTVCLMDTTYKHNNVNFCLASIMVVDGDGNGEIVAHAWLSRDDAIHWELFLEKYMWSSMTKHRKYLFVSLTRTLLKFEQ